MTCDDTPLLRLIQNRLPRSEATRVSLHVTGCPLCRQRLTVILALEEHFRRRRPRPDRPVWLAMAAAALLLLLLPLLRNVSPDVSPSGTLTVTTPYPIVSLITRADDGDDTTTRAYQAYAAGDYRRAEELLRGSDSETDRFLLGLCLYMLQRNQEAAEVLGGIRDSGQFWPVPAGWYQANALIRLSLIPEARPILQELSTQQDQEIAAKAVRLLERLH